MTPFQTYTHVQEYLDYGQSEEGGPPFTISDWFRPRYGPNVCLLLNHRETFRVVETERLFFFSNKWDLRFLFSRTIEKLGSHSRALIYIVCMCVYFIHVCHAQPSLGFTEYGPKKREYPVSGSCVDENTFLMSEVNGQTG